VGNILPFIRKTHNNTKMCLISMELIYVSTNCWLKIYHRTCPEQNHMSRLESTNRNICNRKSINRATIQCRHKATNSHCESLSLIPGQSMGICGAQSGTRTGFLWVLWFFPYQKSVQQQSIFTLLGAFPKLSKATISFVMSVCLSAWNNSAPTRCSSIKFDI
jgi:hypothetical protein